MRNLLLLVLLTMTGCNAWLLTGEEVFAEREARFQREYEMRMIKELCEGNTLTGVTEGFTIALEGRRNKLESVRAHLTLERYRKLQQDLEGYSVEWELLYQEIQAACRTHAVLLARGDSTSRGMREAEDAYQERLRAARDFVYKIQSLKYSADTSS